MPRITYADRFATLLAKDYLSDRDRAFAESLQRHYQRKRALTPGRRRCFLQLEERYATRPEPVDGADELDVIIVRIQQTAGARGWDFDFITSVQSQLRAGRNLSERQREILGNITEKYSDDAMTARDEWVTAWDADKAERYRVVMTYYGYGGYYGRQVQAFRDNPDIIPSMDEYARVTDNKFAKKVLAGWFSEPRFPVGSMVSMGAGANWTARQHCGSTGMGVVVGVNVEVSTSAAKGCKVYKILPVGSAQTFNVEERTLKAARVPKKKKKK